MSDTSTRRVNPVFVALILASAAVLVAQIALLPDNVAMQVGADGSVNWYAPKPLAIVVPTIVSFGGAIAYLLSERKGGAQGKNNPLIIALIGVAMGAISIVMNMIL